MTGVERIKLLSAIRKGERIDEDVLVRNLGDGLLRTLHSPLFGPNHAAGDYIRLDGSELGYAHVRRGGNVCVQVEADVAPELDALVVGLADAVAELGGWPDATAPLIGDREMHAFTIPAAVGFDRIDAVLQPLEGCAGLRVRRTRSGRPRSRRPRP